MGLHEGYYGVAGGQILHPDTLEIFLHVRFTEQLVQLGREGDVRHKKKNIRRAPESHGAARETGNKLDMLIYFLLTPNSSTG